MFKRLLPIACSMVAALSLLWVPNCAAQAPAGGNVSSHFVPDDGLALIVAYPAELLKHPSLEMYPLEILRAQSKVTTGVDPMDIEELRLVVGMPGPNGPAYGLILRLSRDYAVSDLTPQLIGAAQQGDDLELYPFAAARGNFLVQPDARTFVIGPRWYVETVAKAADSNAPLASLANKIPRQPGVTALAVVAPIRPMLTGLAKQEADRLPPELQSLPRIPELVDAMMLNAQLSGGFGAHVQLVSLCADDASAEELEQILNQSIDFGRRVALAQIERQIRDDGPVAEATVQYAKRLSDMITKTITPERDGRRLRVALGADEFNIASTGVMVGLLLPAVQAAREAARRTNATNNLKQIMLAFHNYHDAYKHVPEPAIRSEDGEPLLSWRVAILPFVEQQALYDQFHLDEPWDSEHNKALLEQMPPVFEDPSVVLPPGQTVLQAVVGEEIGLKAEGKTSFRDITDGTSNTILVVETDAASAVPWTKPEDVTIDMQNPLAKMGKVHAGGFNAAFADGSIHFISNNIDLGTFQALLTRAGGEVVGNF